MVRTSPLHGETHRRAMVSGPNPLRPTLVEYFRRRIWGRFDGDCSVGKYEVESCGAEARRELMEFERSLCIKMSIRTGRLSHYGKVGEQTTVGKKKIITTLRKPRFSDSSDFLKVVGNLNVEWRGEKLRKRR